MPWLFLAGVVAGGVVTAFCLLCVAWVNAVCDIHAKEHDAIERTLASLNGYAAREQGLTEENRRLRQRVRELEHELRYPEREEWGRE